MTIEEAIAKLAEIDDGDPEAAHMDADAILLAAAPREVGDAYRALVERCGDWWYA